jgi:hypothetical protein
MPEQKIKYVVRRKGTNTYWSDNVDSYWDKINYAKAYSINEKISSSEELIALHPNGMKEVIR